MVVHDHIRNLRFLQPYIEKLGPFINDLIMLIEPFSPKIAETIGKIKNEISLSNKKFQTSFGIRFQSLLDENKFEVFYYS